MTDGKERAIEELNTECREAIARAEAFLAQAVEYISAARFETEKARGYLKQAENLADIHVA